MMEELEELQAGDERWPDSVGASSLAEETVFSRVEHTTIHRPLTFSI